MSQLRLVVFDVDGTLVDSQADILGAMAHAFEALGLACPGREDVLNIVGLSLDVAMAKLVPDQDPRTWGLLAEAYKDSYATRRRKQGADVSSPLYPGASEAVDRLARQDHTLLGVATGKSRRGLTKLLDAHGLSDLFLTTQVADDHPSKPNPAMLLRAMADTGVGPESTVMIGDTTYDMDMARGAGVRAIGVGWGYHPAIRLGASADIVLDHFDQVPGAVDQILGDKT